MQITGVVDQIVDDFGLLALPVKVGMPFVGSLMYDTDVADLGPDVTQVGYYDQPLGSFLIDVGGNHFQTLLGANFRIEVRIDSAFPPNSGDIVFLSAVGDTALTDLEELTIGMVLQDWTSAALSSDVLPRPYVFAWNTVTRGSKTFYWTNAVPFVGAIAGTVAAALFVR